MNEKTTFNHKEAFCVMTYRCKSCGHEERVWNSRDGITPFCIGCPRCGKPEHYHEDWFNDRFDPMHRMFMVKGERMFVNMTKERARNYAVKNVDSAIESGRLPKSRRNDVIRTATASYYGDGTAPDIVEVI